MASTFDLATFITKWTQMSAAQKRATIARLSPEHQSIVRNALAQHAATPPPPPTLQPPPPPKNLMNPLPPTTLRPMAPRSEYEMLSTAPTETITPEGKRIITSVFPIVMGDVDSESKLHQLKFLVPSGRPSIQPATSFQSPVRLLRRDVYNKRQLALSQGETGHLDAMDSMSIATMAKKKPKKKVMETDKLAPSASTWQRTHLFQKKTFRVFKSKIDKQTRERNMEWVLADRDNENVYDGIPGHPTGMDDESDVSLYGIFSVDGGYFKFTPLDGLYKLSKRRKVIHGEDETSTIPTPSAVDAVLNHWQERKKRQIEEEQVKADGGLQLKAAERRVKPKVQKMKVVDRGNGLFSDDEGDAVDALDELDFDIAAEFQDDEEFNAEDVYYEEANEGNARKRQLENYLRAEGLVHEKDEQSDNRLSDTGQYLAMAYSLHDKEGLIGGYREVRDPYAKAAGVDPNERKKRLAEEMRSIETDATATTTATTAAAARSSSPPPPPPTPPMDRPFSSTPSPPPTRALLTPASVKKEQTTTPSSPKKKPIEPLDPTLLTAQDLIDVLKTKPSMELKELVAALKPKIQRNLAVNKPLMKTLVRQVAIVKDHIVRLRT